MCSFSFLGPFPPLMHVLPYSFPVVCVIIPLTPRRTGAASTLQTPSTLPTNPTPPPTTPLTLAAARHRRPFSPRRSPSYESSISLKDLAPPALFKSQQFNFLSPPAPCATPQRPPPADARRPAAFPPATRPASPIPHITSPLPPSPTPNSPIPPSAPGSSASLPASPSLPPHTSDPSAAEPNASWLTTSGSSSGASCRATAPSSMTATTPPILTLAASPVVAGASEPPAAPAPPTFSSPSSMTSPSVAVSPSDEALVTQLTACSRPVSPLSFPSLPPGSASGSRCPSPAPPSPPLRSLSPCPLCQFGFAPAVSPPPPRLPVDPSTTEILF
ncbi:uncharacterized protein LOC134135195 [Pungitius pungitius]|uniref:uncharacterized protein LOC134135195 n=1 Tax=Pungitius pungitius TaxID=134920 RepID=UPI002E0E0CE4